MPKKGYKQTEEHKRKNSEARKKFYKDNPHYGFQKGNDYSSNWKGRRHKDISKQKISESMQIKNPMFDPKVREKVSRTRKERKVSKGEKNPNWKGGVTPLHTKIRNLDNYRLWRTSIFERDDYTCQECREKCKKNNTIYLNAHHIDPFYLICERNNIESIEDALQCKELWCLDNGITLCKSCHDKKPKGREIKVNHKQINE